MSKIMMEKQWEDLMNEDKIDKLCRLLASATGVDIYTIKHGIKSMISNYEAIDLKEIDFKEIGNKLNLALKSNYYKKPRIDKQTRRYMFASSRRVV